MLTLTLNRPGTRNAIDPELRDALAEAIDGAAKRLLHLAAETDQRSAVVAESLAQTALLQSDDHLEGLAAARERREPNWDPIGPR